MNHIPTVAELAQAGKSPEVLFWVGCAGSFDTRAQRVSKAFAEILDRAGISFAILGNEEMCTGDPARRAGNEFIFQMLAVQNIQTLNGYNIKKIVTACPHCFNIIKNDYPELGGNYDIVHHTTYINELLQTGKISISGGSFKGKKITYHDSCYLGRINGIYEIPRELIYALDADLVEMKRSKQNGLCCGAGGAQMFKEDEPGQRRINQMRAEEALGTGAEIIALNCPFCNTMLSDGVTEAGKEDETMVLDISEMILKSMDVSNDTSK